MPILLLYPEIIIIADIELSPYFYFSASLFIFMLCAIVLFIDSIDY
jgi:hypothetical protein